MACDCCCISTLVYVWGLVSMAAFFVPKLKKLFGGKKEFELKEKNWKKDTVYLFQFAGNSTLSSYSPFCIKVEAFLRLHKIKFERRDTMTTRGKNNLLPMVEYNGEQFSDSQIIIKRLSEKFNIEEYTNEEQSGYARAVDRMVDNHSFNVMLNFKAKDVSPMTSDFAKDYNPMLAAVLLPIINYYFPTLMRKRIVTSIGKFTDEEYKELLRTDFAALAGILGKKQFLFGDKPTLADCTLFGQVASMYYMAPGHRTFVNEAVDEQKTLKEWLVRFRDTVFEGSFHV